MEDFEDDEFDGPIKKFMYVNRKAPYGTVYALEGLEVVLITAAFDQDVFINAVGGVKITEPAADLAVLLAINSSMRNKPLPRGLVVFGEVGLAGEIRPAPRGQERLREAAKLGFSIAVIPKANAPKQAIEGLKVIPVERIDDALQKAREIDDYAA